MIQYKYGELARTGESIDIDQVPKSRSEREKYICPLCKAPFSAAKGDYNAPHFRHKGNPCKRADVHQTALHMRAKEIIEKEKRFFLPPLVVKREQIDLSDLPKSLVCKLPEQYVYQEAVLLECPSVKLEKRISDIVPDVVAYTSSGPYLIEIYVTNKLTDEKIEKAAKIGYPLLEVVLHDLKNEIISEEQLRHIVIESYDKTEWKYSPEWEKALAAAQKWYDNQSRVKNYRQKRAQTQKKWQEDRAAWGALQDAEEKRLRELEKQRQNEDPKKAVPVQTSMPPLPSSSGPKKQSGLRCWSCGEYRSSADMVMYQHDKGSGLCWDCCMKGVTPHW